MKTMQKVLTLALVLVMVLAMATTAYAAGTLNITGSTKTEYTLYKIADVEVVEGGDSKYKYELTTQWADFTAPGYFTVRNGFMHWEKNTASASDAAAIAQLAKQYKDTKNLTSSLKVAVNGQIDNLENGYYLLVPNNDSACGVVVVTDGKTVTISEKTSAAGLPKIAKSVLEDTTNTYGESNTAEIGEKITFQTTITAGGNDSKYVLHDAMDEHLHWLGGGNITRDGNTLTKDTDYTVVSNPEDGCTFHVEFSDNICSSLNEGATLIVTYYAVLTADADTANGHENKTWLTHTKEQVKTNEASTLTHTFQIEVTKKDTDGNLLPDAGFVLKDNLGKYYSWGDITHEGATPWTSKGIIWVDDIEQATKFTTDDSGVIYFNGLDSENFTLVEKDVPGGYTGSGEVAVSTKNADPDTGISKVTVINTLGAALPETGGIGTTVFYVLGGLLVVTAVVLLTTKKRVNATK